MGTYRLLPVPYLPTRAVPACARPAAGPALDPALATHRRGPLSPLSPLATPQPAIGAPRRAAPTRHVPPRTPRPWHGAHTLARTLTYVWASVRLPNRIGASACEADAAQDGAKNDTATWVSSKGPPRHTCPPAPAVAARTPHPALSSPLPAPRCHPTRPGPAVSAAPAYPHRAAREAVQHGR